MKTQIATALAIASSAILPARATDASKTPAPVESQGTGGKEGGKFDPAGAILRAASRPDAQLPEFPATYRQKEPR